VVTKGGWPGKRIFIDKGYNRDLSIDLERVTSYSSESTLMDKTSQPQPSLKDIQWWVWLVLLGLGGIGVGLVWGAVRLFASFWDAFNDLDKTVAAAIVAGIFTVIATTITVMVGRYFEEKRKQSELHREQKITMYDAFIARIFKIFTNEEIHPNETDSDTATQNLELVEFLREHQRQFLLWSNAGVIRAYAEWQKTLTGAPNAQTVLKMERFFLAVRKDLGHSNWGIKQGDTARFLLRHTDFFLQQIKSNPNITLSELARLEEEAELSEPTDA